MKGIARLFKIRYNAINKKLYYLTGDALKHVFR